MRMQTARAFVRMKCVLSEVARIIVHSFMDFCAHSSQNGLANGRTSSYSYAIVMWDCGGRWDFRFAGRFWVNIFHFTNSAQWVKFMFVCMWNSVRVVYPLSSAGWKTRIHSLAQLRYLSLWNGFRFVRQLLLRMCCWNCCPRWLFSLYWVLSSSFFFHDDDGTPWFTPCPKCSIKCVSHWLGNVS